MKLCFGTLFAILYQIKKSGTQPKLYSALLEPWDDNPPFYDPSDVSKRIKGIEDVPQASKDQFLEYESDDIAAFYKKHLRTYLDENKFKNAIAAIKIVLAKDSIEACTKLGNCNYTKGIILNHDTFDFYSLIANIMNYCCSINNVFQKDVAEIKKGFVNNCSEESKKIFLEDSITNIHTDLETTIRSIDFNKVFKELPLNDESLHITNPTKLKLFRPNISNKEFDYEALIAFIYQNIGRYVFSRAKKNDYESNDMIDSFVSDAIKCYCKNNNKENSSDSFSEIMLYSFMECVLHAPKILSAFEVKNHPWIKNAKSSGVYFLPAGTIGGVNQIILGSSSVTNSLEAAINEAFSRVKEIIANKNDEHNLVDRYLLQQVMPEKQRKFMESVILPSEKSPEKEYSFGIFITYRSKEIDRNELSNADFLQQSEENMINDINSSIPKIRQIITNDNLDSFSYYLFFLPLGKGVEDSTEIMEKALGGI